MLYGTDALTEASEGGGTPELWILSSDMALPGEAMNLNQI